TRFSRDWSSDVCSSDLSETDRRVLVITLTDRGKEVVNAITPQHQQAVAQVFGNIPPERLELLCELLAEVDRGIDEAKKALEAMAAPPPPDQSHTTYKHK